MKTRILFLILCFLGLANAIERCPTPVCANGNPCTNTSYGYDCGCGRAERRFTTGQHCERAVGVDDRQFTLARAWLLSFFSTDLFFLVVAVIFQLVVSFGLPVSSRKPSSLLVKHWSWTTLSLFVGILLYILPIRSPMAFDHNKNHVDDNTFLIYIRYNRDAKNFIWFIDLGLAQIIFFQFNSVLVTLLGSLEFSNAISAPALMRFFFADVDPSKSLVENADRTGHVYPHKLHPRFEALFITSLLLGLVVWCRLIMTIFVREDRAAAYPYLAHNTADLVVHSFFILVLVLTAIMCIWICALIGGNVAVADIVSRDVFNTNTTSMTLTNVDPRKHSKTTTGWTISWFLAIAVGCLVIAVALALDLAAMRDTVEHGTIISKWNWRLFKAEIVLIVFMFMHMARHLFACSMEVIHNQERRALDAQLKASNSTQSSQRSTGASAAIAIAIDWSVKNNTHEVAQSRDAYLELLKQIKQLGTEVAMRHSETFTENQADLPLRLSNIGAVGEQERAVWLDRQVCQWYLQNANVLFENALLRSHVLNQSGDPWRDNARRLGMYRAMWLIMHARCSPEFQSMHWNKLNPFDAF